MGKIINSCTATPLPAWSPPLMTLNDGTGRTCARCLSHGCGHVTLSHTRCKPWPGQNLFIVLDPYKVLLLCLSDAFSSRSYHPQSHNKCRISHYGQIIYFNDDANLSHKWVLFKGQVPISCCPPDQPGACKVEPSFQQPPPVRYHH